MWSSGEDSIGEKYISTNFQIWPSEIAIGGLVCVNVQLQETNEIVGCIIA